MSLHVIISNKKYIQLTTLISLVVGFLIHFPELVSLTDAQEKQSLFPGMSAADVLFEVGYTFFSLLVLFWMNIFLFGFNNPAVRMPWWKMLLSFVLVWLSSRLLGELFVFMHNTYPIPAIDAMVHHYLHPVRDFIISLIVTGTCYISYLIRERQSVLLQNGELVAENIQNQYQTLKNQLNPHMLFNSLNTLQSLVRESPEKAQDYIHELSRVLRYTLQENEAYTVALKEEMEFVEAYLFLMKMRYEENLQFEIGVAERLLGTHLPPLSIQTLVENAIKHNEISNRKPLVIKIFTVAGQRDDDAFLCVENALQLRRTTSVGTGIGLSNLAKRYKLLFGKEINITEASGKFSVCIPLINT